MDEKSARLGLPGTRESMLAIDRDHSQICKFATEDGVYEQVEQEILRLIDDALAVAAERAVLTTPNLNEQNGRLLSTSPFFNSPRLFLGRQFSSPTLNGGSFMSTDAPGKRSGPIFDIPHNKNRNSVGRRDACQRLVDQLISTEAQYRIALCGLGGVGKSDLAIRCAYSIKERNPGISVFWIQAGGFEQSHQSILKIARSLEIEGVDAPNADVFGLVRHCLSNPERGPWVMIIDHADDFQSLTISQRGKKLGDYIPDCLHGSVLLTTRNKKVAAKFADKAFEGGIEEVAPLLQKESEQLVYQLLDQKQYQDGGVSELTKFLNYFPLAIVQAASFIRGNDITIDIYLQRFSENQEDVLEIFGHGLNESDNSDAVTTTWMISFKQLQANNQYAADLLSLMAFLDHSEVPETLLRSIDDSKTGLQFESACGELKAFSFITETSIRSSTTATAEPMLGFKYFNVQPVVQLVMRQWLRKHDLADKWSDAAIVALSKALPSAETSKEQWKEYEVYLPHIQTVCEQMGDTVGHQEHKASLLHKASWYFRIRGHHATAARMARQALEIQKATLGADDEATLASIHNLSRILFEQGKIEESESLQVPAIEICKVKLGEDHKSTLRNRGHLAAIRGVQGRYEEALELQLNIMEISERSMGQCPETWLAMRDLAVTLSYVGRKHEAESLQVGVYNERREHLGEDHPDTLIIMTDLATTYIERANFEEAEELLINMLQHSRRILGDRHPHTVAAYEDLREVLKSQGKFKHARRLEDMVRKIHRERKQTSDGISVGTRPSLKRAMSDSVVTYIYRRPSDAISEEDSDDTTEKGLGLKFPSSRSRASTLVGVEEDDEDAEEDDAETEEFATIKKALVLMMRGMASLPTFNIVPMDRTLTAGPIVPPSSISTPHLGGPDASSNDSRQIQPLTRVSTVLSESSNPSSSAGETSYSNYRLLRTIEKKYERNVNKETYDQAVKSGIELLEDTKTKWKNVNFKDLKSKRKSWMPKKKNSQEEADIDQEDEAAQVDLEWEN